MQTAGISIIKDRDFTIDDRSKNLPVTLINETMARRFWPASDPVGRKLRLKEDQRWMTIVGVVPDIKHTGLMNEEGPVVYIPYAQKTQEWLAWTTLLVRRNSNPLDLTVRNVIHGLDKDQPVGEIDTLANILSRLTAIPRFTTFIACALAGLALLIAVMGVYGLLSYTVEQRTPELGIRLTLGASPLEVSWLLMRQAMVRVLCGVVAGIVAAWWVAQWLETLLFHVRPHDPRVLAGVSGLLIMASAIAVLVPARRVMKIDPTTALRAE